MGKYQNLYGLNLHAILTALLMFERWTTVFENAKK
jgi:hypothetical protein